MHCLLTRFVSPAPQALMISTTAALLMGIAATAGAQTQSSATAAQSPPMKKVSAKRKAPATPREQLKSQAQGLALATDTVETISAGQLDIAARVLTGNAQCEFNQTVSIDQMPERPGVFRVGFNKATYTMVPEETTTGAVRLVDKRNGVIWLQIPVKSMLMDSKAGQRLVDACTQSEQRAAVEAAKDAIKSPNSLE